ncbi:DNA polymerase III subunit delta [Rurimicrobium arvi]|uniref:DNA polymerase III subunit delta n=1 Tax=Rurimicrobium arvi TaxID=2049916 RepID=A0ABP8MH51_9BACT
MAVMTFKQIADSIRKKEFAPVYVLDGEEAYFLDQLMDLFEANVLSPSEKEFNLSVLYGRETNKQDLLNACMRFPMFADKQLVLLKDAAAMDKFNELEKYIEQPCTTTILVIEYRNKKVDGKTRIAKAIKDKAAYFTAEKVKEDAMPAWLMQWGKEIGFEIPEKEAEMLTLYLGSHLQRIVNEIEKIRINVPEQKMLTGALIQKYIGISREYNLFDFVDEFIDGNKDKYYRMLSYFLSNMKSSPMVLVTASLQNKFQALYRANYAAQLPEKDWATAIGGSPWFAKNVVAKTKRWPLYKVEQCMMTIAEFNRRSVGIDSDAGDSENFKELIGRLELIAAS